MLTPGKVISKRATITGILTSIKWAAVMLIITLNMEVLAAAVIINARTLRIGLDLHMNGNSLQKVGSYEPQVNQTSIQIHFSTATSTLMTWRLRILRNTTS